MSVPLKNLPVVQHWDCHSCSHCCRIEAVIADAEKRRIEGLGLEGDAEVAAKPWFASAGRGSKTWKLKHRADGSCVFLTAENRCRIQERFGADAKPFVCRMFPFVLTPAGDHWRVGLNFSCPSSAANRGRPIADAEAELVQLSRELERHTGRSAQSAPAPLLNAGQKISWPDVCRVVDVLVEIVGDRSCRPERRLRKCLAVSRVCARSQFENISGARLTKYLRAVHNAVEAEVPADASAVAAPDGLFGRALFRVLLAAYAREDRDVRRAAGVLRGLGRIGAAVRFARGRGRVPRVNESLADIAFEDVERPSALPAEVDETLERYYLVKLSSMQFCGSSNFGLSLLDGLDSLVLTLPLIVWLARAFKDREPLQAVQRAIEIVDNHFGGNPMLGFPHYRSLMRMMSQRGEVERLVAWYGR